jgi:hypothetical protein
VLAPNSPLRAPVVALAQATASTPQPAMASEPPPSQPPPGQPLPVEPPPAKPKRSPAHSIWAMLLARIFETLPLTCPHCGAQASDHRLYHRSPDAATDPRLCRRARQATTDHGKPVGLHPGTIRLRKAAIRKNSFNQNPSTSSTRKSAGRQPERLSSSMIDWFLSRSVFLCVSSCIQPLSVRTNRPITL